MVFVGRVEVGRGVWLVMGFTSGSSGQFQWNPKVHLQGHGYNPTVHGGWPTVPHGH